MRPLKVKVELRGQGWRDESGVAAVEFAVVLPLLLLILFGILDFGRAFSYDNSATHLSSEGARWATVDSNPGAPSQTLQQYILSQASNAEMKNNATVCIKFPSGATTQGNPVEVTVAVKFDWLPFLRNAVFGGTASSTLTGKSIMRLERPPTSYITGCYHR